MTRTLSSFNPVFLLSSTTTTTLIVSRVDQPDRLLFSHLYFFLLFRCLRRCCRHAGRCIISSQQQFYPRSPQLESPIGFEIAMHATYSRNFIWWPATKSTDWLLKRLMKWESDSLSGINTLGAAMCREQEHLHGRHVASVIGGRCAPLSLNPARHHHRPPRPKHPPLLQSRAGCRRWANWASPWFSLSRALQLSVCRSPSSLINTVLWRQTVNAGV